MYTHHEIYLSLSHPTQATESPSPANTDQYQCERAHVMQLS